MIGRTLCGALLVFGATLSAQAPAPAVAAPKPPKGPTKAEFRVGGFMVSGERNYDYYGVTGTSGSIRGVEVLLRGSGAGLYVRSLSGTFGKQPKVIRADARILLFPPAFTIFGGVGKRGLSGLVDNVYDFVTAGVSSTINIGGTGLRTHISGGMILSKEKPAATAIAAQKSGQGMEAEAAVYYRLPGVPLFLMAGYRTETFTGTTKSGTSTFKSPEEVRGMRFGGGIQFGGH